MLVFQGHNDHICAEAIYIFLYISEIYNAKETEEKMTSKQGKVDRLQRKTTIKLDHRWKGGGMDGGASRGLHCLAIGLLLDGRKDASS